MSTTAPTFWQVAKRPRWIAVLIACIAVAVVFAILGQWQIERAIEQGRGETRDTETAVPLESVATPNEPLTTEAGGRIVSVSGDDVAADYRTLAGRNQDGRIGWWVIGRVLVPQPDGEPASLAVALSWSESRENAEAAAAILRADAGTVGVGQIAGRYMPSEAPTQGNLQTREREAMSVAALVNEWDDWNGRVYAGYLILDQTQFPEGGAAVPGDEPIVQSAPEVDTEPNTLNVFYAVEWVAFMLFAFYLWYRLVRDALERELEELEDAEAAGA